MRSTGCGLLLLLSLVPCSAGAEEKPRRSSFTDSDLEAYASRRERESRPAPDPTPAPLPAAPEPPASLPPVALEPPHVVIDDLTGNISAEHKQRAEAIGDRILDFYHGGLAGPVHVPTRYLADPAAFRAEVRRVFGRDANVGGFYWGSDIYIGPTPDISSILIHELNHVLVGKIVSSPPPWLNEGLSEFFQEASLDDQGLRIRIPAARQSYLREWRSNGGRPSLQEILRTPPEDMISHDGYHSWGIRALSWSLIDFLVSTEDGRALLLKYLDELNTRRTGGDPYTAMVMAFSGSIQQFEAEWIKHVDQRLAGR